METFICFKNLLPNVFVSKYRISFPINPFPTMLELLKQRRNILLCNANWIFKMLQNLTHGVSMSASFEDSDNTLELYDSLDNSSSPFF